MFCLSSAKNDDHSISAVYWEAEIAAWTLCWYIGIIRPPDGHGASRRSSTMSTWTETRNVAKSVLLICILFNYVIIVLLFSEAGWIGQIKFISQGATAFFNFCIKDMTLVPFKTLILLWHYDYLGTICVTCKIKSFLSPKIWIYMTLYFSQK